ncbi:hypothetical protein A0H81_14085 [Grifola frondosa]|uniref:F-box domain-containing protein n=1 Tax=Grifola frondosa TaxID=5627 RepID=A0A1C7LMC8_GRIFR|nr:hypothetical protein A0H81_14085 [Grifola frondosa]
MLASESLRTLHIALDDIIYPELRWKRRGKCEKVLLKGDNRTTRDLNIEMLFTTMQSIAPFLKHIDITGYLHPFSLLPLAKFPCLRIVDLHKTIVDMRVLRALSTLRGLEDMTIDFGMPPGNIPRCDGFCSLLSLVVVGRAAGLAQLFTSISPPKLDALYMTFSNDWIETTSGFRVCLESIRSASFSQSLGEISVTILPRWKTKDFLTDLIEPLLSLKMVDSVSLKLDESGYSVSTQDIENMASAWPKLQKLVMRWMPASVPPPSSVSRASRAIVPSLRSWFYRA